MHNRLSEKRFSISNLYLLTNNLISSRAYFCLQHDFHIDVYTLWFNVINHLQYITGQYARNRVVVFQLLNVMRFNTTTYSINKLKLHCDSVRFFNSYDRLGILRFRGLHV